jgi:hypothetical protein
MHPFTTIPLVLKYAWLSAPDQKYKKYSVNALGDMADAKVAAFFKELEEKVKSIIKDELSALPEAKRKHIEANWKFTAPFSQELDKEYKPTGLTVIKARSNADHKPVVLTNIGGKLCPTERPVYSWSIGQLNVLLNPYFDAAKERYGCSMLLSKVNVIKWADKNSAVSGDSSGFELGEDQSDGAPFDTEAPPSSPATAQKNSGDF